MEVSFLFKINFVVILVCLSESALSPEIRRAYHDFLAGKGLYKENEGIVLLNATNFRTTIYGTKNAWLIEFYNSWCGHCHKFAPAWRALAADLQEWKNVIQLGALDCAHDDHISICRDYNIMAYPTVKFFSARSPPSSLGTEFLTGKTETEMTRNLVGVLQKEQIEGRGSDWPVITPYWGYDMSSLGKKSHDIQYVFLVFADGNDSMAGEVILDFSNVKEIEIRGVVAENEVLAKLLEVKTYPSLLVLEKSKTEPVHMSPGSSTREAYRLEIKSFLKDKGIQVPEEPQRVNAPASMPNLHDLQKARNEIVQLAKIRDLGDVVFLVDLEKTLKYSLEHEVSSRQEITGPALSALNSFLGVLSKHFPSSESGITFMQNLRHAIQAETEIKGLKFKSELQNLSKAGLDSLFPTREDWIGCRGSEERFRRYPCGVWTLFHYMTVNALRESQRPQFDPLEVLEAMLGYVTYFFGCTECSRHFQKMTVDRSMRAKVKTAEDAVLWLWSAHNEVNGRLARDDSEDPEFPKIQFPSETRCSHCRYPNGTWNERVVLEYLVSVYGRDKLNRMGTDTELSVSGSEAPVEGPNDRQKAQLFEEENPKKISKDFNVFDISLCVVLYVVSALICVGVCLKFVLKRKYRRKSHGQDLLGRI